MTTRDRSSPAEVLAWMRDARVGDRVQVEQDGHVLDGEVRSVHVFVRGRA
jgi:hypothetical protein